MLVDFIAWKGTRKVNTTVNSLHTHTVLFILIKITEYLEKILLWYVWYKLDHIV